MYNFWGPIVVLTYILYKWEDIVRLSFLTAIINKNRYDDMMILPRFILVIIIAILVHLSMC